MNQYLKKSLNYHIKKFSLNFKNEEVYFDYLNKQNVGILYPEHPMYPEFWVLRTLKVPCILYRGDLQLLNQKIVAVIGSRNLTETNRQWMLNELTEFIKHKSIGFCSGAAMGTDQLAHKISLWQGGASIAILPCGISKIYPVSFRKLLKGKESQFLLLSEYPMEQEVKKFYFYQRNRLIVSLADFVIGVQASRCSGTSMSLRLGQEMGVPIVGLPSHPYDIAMQGGLDFVYSGAYMVRDYKDLLSLGL